MLKKRLNLTICKLDVLSKFCFQNLYAKPSLKKIKLAFSTITGETFLQNKINLIVIFFLIFFKEVGLKLKNSTTVIPAKKDTAVSSLFYEILLTKKEQIQLFLDLFFFQTAFRDVDYRTKKVSKNSRHTFKMMNISLDSLFEFNVFSKFLDLKSVSLEVSLKFTNWNTKTDKILKNYSFFWLL